MLRHILTVTLAVLAALPALPASAQREDFRREFERRDQGRPVEPVIIGSERIESRSERVVFRIPRRDGRVSELMFRPLNGAVLLNAVEITYGDGRKQRVDIVDRLTPGEQSRPIVIDPERGPIEEVVVWKRPSWLRAENTLQLIGVPASRGRDDVASTTWEVLERGVADSRDDRITFNFDRRGPRVAALQFRSVDDPVLLGRADVEFGNGERASFDLFARLSPGESSRVIEFQTPRHVKSVVLWKRKSWRPGRTTVDLLGVESLRGQEAAPWAGIGPAIPRGWILFGSAEVGFKVDRDVIKVGRDIGRFERIALRVYDNDIYLREFTIVYGNGDRDRRVVETALPKGSQTRPIDLDGKRFIKEIELVYRSRRGGNDFATVDVLGDLAKDWYGERGAWKRANDGWQILSAQRAPMSERDRDAFIVGERYGRFKALRLTVRGNEVKIYSMKIYYGNGDIEEVKMSETLSNGKSTPPIDLKGRSRVIERIMLDYRANPRARSAGIVEIWGRE